MQACAQCVVSVDALITTTTASSRRRRLYQVTAPGLFYQAQSQAEEALAVLERIALALRQQMPDAAQRQPFEATIRYRLLAAQAQSQWAQQLRTESASSLASKAVPDPVDPAA